MDSNFSFDSSDSSNMPYMDSQMINHHQQPHSSFNRSLHAVRKPANPNKKPGNAMLPPNPTRVYKVDRMKFRELVQMLTGASSVSTTIPTSHSQPHRLREVAPPPLDFATPAPPTSHTTTGMPLSTMYREMMTEAQPDARPSQASTGVSLGLGLSPTSPGWCSFLSPGTLSSFEPSAVL